MSTVWMFLSYAAAGALIAGLAVTVIAASIWLINQTEERFGVVAGAFLFVVLLGAAAGLSVAVLKL